MIIKAQQSIIDNENNRIHEQKVIIDLEDEFVTISHNGDELNMSTKAFDELIKMVCEASKTVKQYTDEKENVLFKSFKGTITTYKAKQAYLYLIT